MNNLKYKPKPLINVKYHKFFEYAIEYVKKARKQDLVAVEFFGERALELLRMQKKTNPAFKEIPDMAPELNTAVYAEYHGNNEEAIEYSEVSDLQFSVHCLR